MLDELPKGVFSEDRADNVDESKRSYVVQFSNGSTNGTTIQNPDYLPFKI